MITPTKITDFNPLPETALDEDECPHEEHDHGICLDCGKDIHDDLVAQAEAAFEGDR